MGQSREAYWSAAERAFGKTSHDVGTIRIHCPVTNSSTTNTTPFAIHRMSSAWWNHRVRLMRLLLSVRGDQKAEGLFSRRTCQPVRMISSRKKLLRKCDQLSHAGNPTGADAGRDIRREGGEEVAPGSDREHETREQHGDADQGEREDAENGRRSEQLDGRVVAQSGGSGFRRGRSGFHGGAGARASRVAPRPRARRSGEP